MDERIGCLEFYCRITTHDGTGPKNRFSTEEDFRKRRFLQFHHPTHPASWRLTASYPSSTNNAKLCETLGKTVTEWAYDGFNACLLSMGAEKSGKSHSTFGSGSGLIMGIVSDLFQQLEGSPTYQLGLSLWDVSGNRVRDGISLMRNHATNCTVLPNDDNIYQFDAYRISSVTEAASIINQFEAMDDQNTHRFVRICIIDLSRGVLSTINLCDLKSNQSDLQALRLLLENLSSTPHPYEYSEHSEEDDARYKILQEAGPLANILHPLIAGNSKTYLLMHISEDAQGPQLHDTLEFLDLAERASLVSTVCTKVPCCEVVLDPLPFTLRVESSFAERAKTPESHDPHSIENTMNFLELTDEIDTILPLEVSLPDRGKETAQIVATDENGFPEKLMYDPLPASIEEGCTDDLVFALRAQAAGDREEALRRLSQHGQALSPRNIYHDDISRRGTQTSARELHSPGHSARRVFSPALSDKGRNSSHTASHATRDQRHSVQTRQPIPHRIPTAEEAYTEASKRLSIPGTTSPLRMMDVNKAVRIRKNISPIRNNNSSKGPHKKSISPHRTSDHNTPIRQNISPIHDRESTRPPHRTNDHTKYTPIRQSISPMYDRESTRQFSKKKSNSPHRKKSQSPHKQKVNFPIRTSLSPNKGTPRNNNSSTPTNRSPWFPKRDTPRNPNGHPMGHPALSRSETPRSNSKLTTQNTTRSESTKASNTPNQISPQLSRLYQSEGRSTGSLNGPDGFSTGDASPQVHRLYQPENRSFGHQPENRSISHQQSDSSKQTSPHAMYTPVIHYGEGTASGSTHHPNNEKDRHIQDMEADLKLVQCTLTELKAEKELEISNLQLEIHQLSSQLGNRSSAHDSTSLDKEDGDELERLREENLNLKLQLDNNKTDPKKVSAKVLAELQELRRNAVEGDKARRAQKAAQKFMHDIGQKLVKSQHQVRDKMKELEAKNETYSELESHFKSSCESLRLAENELIIAKHSIRNLREEIIMMKDHHYHKTRKSEDILTKFLHDSSTTANTKHKLMDQFNKILRCIDTGHTEQMPVFLTKLKEELTTLIEANESLEKKANHLVTLVHQQAADGIRENNSQTNNRRSSVGINKMRNAFAQLCLANPADAERASRLVSGEMHSNARATARKTISRAPSMGPAIGRTKIKDDASNNPNSSRGRQSNISPGPQRARASSMHSARREPSARRTPLTSKAQPEKQDDPLMESQAKTSRDLLQESNLLLQESETANLPAPTKTKQSTFVLGGRNKASRSLRDQMTDDDHKMGKETLQTMSTRTTAATPRGPFRVK